MKPTYEKPTLTTILPVNYIEGLEGDSQYNDANDEGDD